MCLVSHVGLELSIVVDNIRGYLLLFVYILQASVI